jgi:hypothetical protein
VSNCYHVTQTDENKYKYKYKYINQTQSAPGSESKGRRSWEYDWGCKLHEVSVFLLLAPQLSGAACNCLPLALRSLAHAWDVCFTSSFLLLSHKSFFFISCKFTIYSTNWAIIKYVIRKHLCGAIIQWWCSYVYCTFCCVRLLFFLMSWLLGQKSKLSLENKTLIYKCILKPIWTYGIQLWGCAHRSWSRNLVSGLQQVLEVLLKFWEVSLRWEALCSPVCSSKGKVLGFLSQVSTGLSPAGRKELNFIRTCQVHL